MTTASVTRLSLLACLLVGGCVDDAGQRRVDQGDLSPLTSDYRHAIATWARGFYTDPHLLRSARISDPVPFRDSTGRMLWLICLDVDAREAAGGVLGVERNAFGFAPNYVSTPLSRRGSSLIREDCDRQPLAWRALDLSPRR